MLLRILDVDHDININIKIRHVVGEGKVSATTRNGWIGKGIGDEEECRPRAENNKQLTRIAMVG